MEESSMKILEVLVPLFIAIISFILSIVTLALGRRKEKASAKKEEADYAEKISQTAMTLVKPLEDRISSMEREIRVMKRTIAGYEKYVKYLLEGIDTLVQQLIDAGQVPQWKPEEMRVLQREEKE